MNETGKISYGQEQARVVVSILIDSDLYLDMDLHERSKLLHFLLAAYFTVAAK